MNRLLNHWLGTVSALGEGFFDYACHMFVQSAALIVLLLVIDLILRHRVRATFRYWIWMLVFVKLVLPTTLSSPIGIGYWFGNPLADDLAVSRTASAGPVADSSTTPVPEMPLTLAENHSRPESAADVQPVTTSAPVISHVTPLTWQGCVFLVWLAGLLIFAGLLRRRIIFVRRLIAQAHPVDGQWSEMLDHLRRELRIRRKVSLRLSSDTPSPAACGLLKPTILMPATLPDKLSPGKVRAVLVHELAHIKRGDLWVNSAQTLLQIIYFYNPLVWLANAIVHRVREQAVDEMVLVTLGAGADDYGSTLIDVAEVAFFKPSLSLRLIGVVESRKALQGRIKHMTSRPMPENARLGVVGLTIIATAAAILLPMARAEKDAALPQENGNTRSGTDAGATDKFTAMLENGVRVELLGVCEHPTAGKQWWRPDGTPMEAHEFRDYDYDDAVSVEEGEHARLLALKFDEDVVQDIKISWSLEDSRESRFAPDYSDRERTKRRPVQVILASFPEATEATSFRLGVAAGPWKTVAGGAPARGGAHTRDNISQRDVIYHESTEENGRVSISATHLLGREYDCRIYARGKNGEVFEPRRHSNPGSEMRLCKSEFDIPLEEVKWFHLQARPFRWVTFENISLRPGSVTNVNVQPEGAQAEADKPRELREVLLPDVDGTGLMLDLASGEMLKIPEADKPENMAPAIEKLGKGDLVFDSSSLILVRGATSKSVPENANEPFPVYEIGRNLPEVFNLRTSEGVEWTIEIHSADNKGLPASILPR